MFIKNIVLFLALMLFVKDNCINAAFNTPSNLLLKDSKSNVYCDCDNKVHDLNIQELVVDIRVLFRHFFRTTRVVSLDAFKMLTDYLVVRCKGCHQLYLHFYLKFLPIIDCDYDDFFYKLSGEHYKLKSNKRDRYSKICKKSKPKKQRKHRKRRHKNK